MPIKLVGTNELDENKMRTDENMEGLNESEALQRVKSNH